MIDLGLGFPWEEALPPQIGSDKRFPCPILPSAFSPGSQCVLGFLPDFFAWVWSEERCLDHGVTEGTTLRLPEYDVPWHELLAGRMLPTAQVAVPLEEGLALRGLADNLQKKAELVNGLMRKLSLARLGSSQNL